MTDTSAHIDVKMGSERNFGLVFGSIFLILGIIGFMQQGRLWPVFLIASGAFFLLAFLSPGLLRLPNLLWFRFGLLLHAIFSPLVMFLIYGIAFVPIGLIFRFQGKDLLGREFEPEKASYWVKRSEKPGSMTRQF